MRPSRTILSLSCVLCVLVAVSNGVSQRCNKATDLIFLLDGSGSVPDEGWLKEISFAKTIIDSLDITPDRIRVGVVVFSYDIGDVIELKPRTDKSKLKSRLKGLEQPDETTDTAKGIAKVREMFKVHGRTGVPHIAVVLTDGESNTRADTIKQAVAAKSDGINMKAVGIGSGIDMTELKAIATSEEDLFEVSDFESLPRLLDGLTSSICGACKPTFQFASDDVSTQEGVKVTNVDISQEGRRVFNGQSSINIQNFASAEFGSELSIKITYKKNNMPAQSKIPLYRQRRPLQPLVANCEPWWHGRKPSIWIFVGPNTVEMALKTEKETTPVTIVLPVVSGFNTATLLYNGTHVRASVNDVENIQPLTGDVERRETGLALGQCRGFPSFVGEIESFEISECVPSQPDGAATAP